MEIYTAKVVDGKVELPSEAFPEGSEVVVWLSEPAERFQLTPEQSRS